MSTKKQGRRRGPTGLYGQAAGFGLLCALGVLLGPVGRLAGQGPTSQRQRILDEPFRLQMDEQVPTDKRVIFDWGGWFRSSYWALDEDVDRGLPNRDDGYHAARWQQLRLWGYLNLDDVHRFYARGKLDYWDWNHATSYDHNDSDWDGANLDRGWYDFRLSRYQAAYGEPAGDLDLALRIGRQYVEFGSGLALSVPLDAVIASVFYQDWQLTGMLAQSISSTNNVDRSIPGNTKEDRCYWGVQLRYNGWADHEPFAYYFAQTDKDGGDEYVLPVPNRDLEFYNQKFGYDSQYVGLGSTGKFFHRDLQYVVEVAGQWGKSYAYEPWLLPPVGSLQEQENRQNIQTWIFDTELRYIPRDSRQSEVSVEYLLASGDPDRIFTPTNTVGGNRPHTDDRSFSAWGYRNTGLVLAPRLSNLGMVRAGASTFPVKQIQALRELRIGANCFIYHKQQSEGAASDTLSSKPNIFLGSEFDIYADWRITSDLAWTINYGVYLPGDAFACQKDRQMLYSAISLNF
ncbi:MAG: alginate export family protein [Sedimentisphaerales bacterium]|nr:alginate export family protein [Sedimentisphaerales bacterium]